MSEERCPRCNGPLLTTRQDSPGRTLERQHCPSCGFLGAGMAFSMGAGAWPGDATIEPSPPSEWGLEEQGEDDGEPDFTGPIDGSPEHIDELLDEALYPDPFIDDWPEEPVEPWP